jgi:hypothetical protein
MWLFRREPTIEQIKCILREAVQEETAYGNGTAFIRRAMEAGFAQGKQNGPMLTMSKGDCTLALYLAGREPPFNIWSLSAFEKKGAKTRTLVDAGKLKF